MTVDSRHVVVFEPCPIFTVTIEGEPPRPPEVHFHLGGQGTWVGRTVARLGGDVVVCGPLGGESGRVLGALAEDGRTGVRLRAIECSSENGGYVHDRRSLKRTTIVEVESPMLTRHEVDDLYNLVLEEASQAAVLVLTGLRNENIVPPETHERLPSDAVALGCRVVADVDVRTVKTFGGPIEVVKISHEHLPEVRGAPATLVEAVETLRDQGANNVVVSRAEAPVLARLGDAWVEVDPPEVGALDPRGGGDSMTGALAHGMASGLDLLDALRLAAAAGAVNVVRHGLGTGLQETVEALARRVSVREVKAPDLPIPC